jgi:hypothetical protein
MALVRDHSEIILNKKSVLELEMRITYITNNLYQEYLHSGLSILNTSLYFTTTINFCQT